jgi:hypothetical protein
MSGIHHVTAISGNAGCWRREWDSNPRYGFPYTRFPSERLQPLGHPSGSRKRAQYSGRVLSYNPPEKTAATATKSVHA